MGNTYYRKKWNPSVPAEIYLAFTLKSDSPYPRFLKSYVIGAGL